MRNYIISVNISELCNKKNSRFLIEHKKYDHLITFTAINTYYPLIKPSTQGLRMKYIFFLCLLTSQNLIADTIIHHEFTPQLDNRLLIIEPSEANAHSYCLSKMFDKSDYLLISDFKYNKSIHLRKVNIYPVEKFLPNGEIIFKDNKELRLKEGDTLPYLKSIKCIKSIK